MTHGFQSILQIYKVQFAFALKLRQLIPRDPQFSAASCFQKPKDAPFPVWQKPFGGYKLIFYPRLKIFC